MKFQLIPLVLLLGASPALAQETAAPEVQAEQSQAAAVELAVEPPPPPELPPQVQSGQALEPDITIRKTEEETIEEYRLEGRLYMVKITPAAGPAYYMLDTDGNGELDTQEENVTDIAVPQWVLFSWD